MINYLRYLIFTIILLIVGYFSCQTFNYHFDSEAPSISILGIDNGKYYSGDISCKINLSSGYEVSDFSAWLDDEPIAENISINKKSFDYPFSLDSKNIIDGTHKIKVIARSGAKQKKEALVDRDFGIDNQGLQSAIVSINQNHKVPQGRCLHLQVQTNKPSVKAKVKALNSEVLFFPKSKNSLIHEAFLPVDCDLMAQDYPVEIEVKDFIGNKNLLEDKFQVQMVPFKKKILHVQGNKLKSELEFTSLQERDLEDRLEQLSKKSVKEKLWNGSFDIPILMTGISTEFGVIRTSQERGRTVHRALDITAEPKSVIWAAHNGVVVVKDRFTHSGNTVVVDHGQGVLSLYYHLHDFADIEVGQKVKKGNPLGHMGMTGFANGHHLHWEIRVNNQAVDPIQWTQLVG